MIGRREPFSKKLFGAKNSSRSSFTMNIDQKLFHFLLDHEFGVAAHAFGLLFCVSDGAIALGLASLEKRLSGGDELFLELAEFGLVNLGAFLGCSLETTCFLDLFGDLSTAILQPDGDGLPAFPVIKAEEERRIEDEGDERRLIWLVANEWPSEAFGPIDRRRVIVVDSAFMSGSVVAWFFAPRCMSRWRVRSAMGGHCACWRRHMGLP